MRQIFRRLRLAASLALWMAASLVWMTALAQGYYFRLDRLSADVWINADGSAALEYRFAFTNLPGSAAIEYVDVGLPTSRFSLAGAQAQVNGQPVELSTAEYQGQGSGVAVVLGARAIQPGQSGEARLFLPDSGLKFYRDDQDPQYASFNFTPTWFGSQCLDGTTQAAVSLHFPPGVQPAEPRGHAAPPGWPAEPETFIDEQGRAAYTWATQVSADRAYVFGASFPADRLPPGVVVRPAAWERLGMSAGGFFSLLAGLGLIVGAVGWALWGRYATQRRRRQYLPPRVAIEGLGVKRGLTAVEAAILLEQPLDKVLTMMLFGTLRKGAAEVTQRDPLTLKVVSPLPDTLHPYEVEFLQAFQENILSRRRQGLEDTLVRLTQAVAEQMRGFSRRETTAYYREIVRKAWQQVQTNQTPEVQREAFSYNADWMLLDRNYRGQMEQLFRQPVELPNWWRRLDPDLGRADRPARDTWPVQPNPAPAPQPQATRPAVSGPPRLPGSALAASVARSVQDFSAGLLGDIGGFTQGVTNRTNPAFIQPKPSAYPPTTWRWQESRSGLPPSGSPPITWRWQESRFDQPPGGSSSSEEQNSGWRRGGASRGGSSSSHSGGGQSSCACACACAGCACACAGGGR